jgi:CheY-like chemotaxis protein
MGKKKILIVDDAVSNIDLLANMLKGEYSVVAAKTGEKALELATKKHKPDLILLDIVMPEMDGFEVCKKLKSDPYTKDIPVIFVSSLNNTLEHEQGIQVGGADFILKPVSKIVLLQKIQLQLNMIKLVQTSEKEISGENLMDEKSKILIVDDAPENLQIAVEILKDEYSVLVAKSGKKALELLEQHADIDLVLLDIVMPEMDGFEVCSAIKQNQKLAHIPVIYLTILENEKDMLRGFELGAVDYVTKPFDPHVLKARVSTHVELKKYQDILEERIKEKDTLLMQQSKLATLGEMFESITHQWKQPLSTISMINANIRIDQELDTLKPEKLIPFLDSIDNSVEHLTETIDVFRDFLQEDVKTQYFNIKDLIEKTIKLLESKIVNRSIHLDLNVESFEVCTRKNDLVQVLMNIISNAITSLEKTQHNPKNITIDVVKKNKFIEINISDNGDGVPSHLLEKIFQKNFTTKLDKKGSGLGLYICKKIMQKKLDGDISVQSTPSQTSFTVSFLDKN